MTDYKIKYLKYKKKYLNLKKLSGGAPTNKSLQNALRTLGIKMGHATLISNSMQDKTLEEIKNENSTLADAYAKITDYIISQIKLRDLADMIISNRTEQIVEHYENICDNQKNKLKKFT